MARNIGEWWQSILTSNEIRKIEASQKLGFQRLQSAERLNEQLLGMSRDVFGTVKEQIEGGVSDKLPTEFDELINLFKQGGQFGEGGRAEVRRGGQQALASGQVGLTATGMSSGTNVAGLGARVAADEALARKKIEDERVKLLGGALGQAGGARLESRRIGAARQTSLLQTLASLQPRMVSF